MLGNYYYHQIVRKTLVSFGTLFNDIWVRHTDANDGSVGEMKVPLAYGPSQKFLARLEQQADFCLLYTSPSPRDGLLSRMPSSA